jgi:hypothetical protein
LGTYQVQQHEIEAENGASKEDDEEEEEKVNAPPFSRKGTLRLMQARPNDEEGRIDMYVI